MGFSFSFVLKQKKKKQKEKFKAERLRGYYAQTRLPDTARPFLRSRPSA